MLIEEAVIILNRERHRGESAWFTCHGDVFSAVDSDEFFSGFEAVAIAEKYERDKWA